jgi:hypothetical protein
MTVTTALANALIEPSIRLFQAVEIVTPALTLRLFTGGGTLSFSSKTFVGTDLNQGALSGIDPLSEEIGGQAPRARVTVSGVPASAAAAFKEAGIQGGSVMIWQGVQVEATGAVVADPELLFAGEIDTATLAFDQNTSLIEVDCASVWERFFQDEEGARLNDSTQKNLHGEGDRGLEYVTDTEIPLPWASGDARPVLAGRNAGASSGFDAGGFGGGFGGGFNGGVFSL